MLATENNSVYAFDADSGVPLWHVNLGPAMLATTCCESTNLFPLIGITSTPVIDPNAGILYVVAESYENNVTFFRLHALDITTGDDVLTPAVIQGSVPGTSSDSRNGVLTFAPIRHFQRPGLLLMNGNIYIAFASHQDSQPYHGWLFSYSAATLQPTGILCFAPGGQGNGVWQGGVAPAGDANGNVYVETGNGPLDVNHETGTVPRRQRRQDRNIQRPDGPRLLHPFHTGDPRAKRLGSGLVGERGPLLIPGTSLGLAGGKDGKMHVFNTGNLGGYDSAGDQVFQEWQATFSVSGSLPGGFWGGNYIFYNSTLYGFGERDSLNAFAFNGSEFTTTPFSKSTFTVPANGISNDPGMSISAKGTTAGTGTVWAAFSSNGLADGSAQPGVFYAWEANVRTVLWNSDQNSARDYSGSWAKWVPPIVVNGKVYLASFDNLLNVYGLVSTGWQITASSGTPQSATAGTQFASALQATVKDANNNPVSGVTVTFTAPVMGAGATFSGSERDSHYECQRHRHSTAPDGQYPCGRLRGNRYRVGAGAIASFNLTNIAPPPASISAKAGTPQSATVSTAFVSALQAIVKDANSNPLSGITVTFAAPATGASAAFGGIATATAVTNASGIATAPALTANSQAGGYMVTASVAGLGAAASFSLTNLAVSGGGALSGTVTNVSTAANLTAEGTADWVHWGDPSLNRKAGVTPQISTYSIVGSGPVKTYTNDPRTVSWTDGTPTAAGSNEDGIYISSLDNGFSITVPAGPTPQTLTIYVGGWNSGGTLGAHLSDASAPDYVNTTSSVSGLYDANYTLTFNAASAGQTLTVRWVMTSGTGNLDLNGAALSVAGPSISATAGTPQSATVGTAFATALQATVKDAGSNPLSGITVTFTAPATGAGAAFGGSATATAVTNASGIATAPALTANSQAGGYTVTATGTGAGTAASFSLTNLAGSPASITATAGTPQSATVNTPFGAAMQATVRDAGNNPVSGVTVTFTAPATGASAAFGGSATATAVTNSNGIATAPALTANSQAGSYTVSASAAGVGTAASFRLTNLPLSIGGGALTGAVTNATTTANLTEKGIADWVHWGDASLNRKGGVTPQISTYSIVGSGSVKTYTNDPRTLSWTDGTPTGTGSNEDGIYISSLKNGFSFTVPAGTTSQTLSVYVGGWDSGGTLTAHLSDASAADYVNTTASVSGQYDGNYTLTYYAASPGQTLTISWVMTSGTGNVTLNGAALSPGPGITATAGTPQSTAVSTAFATALQATVRDAGNNPVSGVTVTFTAPATGASAAFSGSATATAVTNASGVATAPVLTANSQAGGYTVTASAAGVGTAASFSLTNLAGSAASVSATAGTPQTATVSTAFATALQATVRDASNNPVSGVTVTFTAPATGASAAFSGSATATAVTNASGIATAPALTANTQAGGYAVTASAAGVGTTASFSLTNVAGVAANITATAGTPQSATVSSAFATALQATVKDAGNNPVSGVTVTFTAPATGVSAAFSGSATATAVTNASGVATAPVLTANSQAGSYTVSASAAGVGTTASFSLTNVAGVAANITATAGTPQSATVSSAFATALQATVKDAGNNPVSGVTVTFTAPATGVSAAFSGSATATAVTNASGVATAPVLTANSQVGSYTVSASAAGVGTAASFSLTNLPPSVSGGSLSGAVNTNLTAEGTADWVHWGDASLNRKAGVAPQISTYSIVGSGTVKTYTNDPRTLSWTDGTPAATGSNEDGIYISSQKNGFSFTVPAGTTSQTLTVYVGGWDSGGTLTAHLSDASAADYVNTTTAVSGQYDGNYTLIFNAASAGQTLTITWVMTSGTGNVSLSGATLSVTGPSISATAGTPQNATVSTAFAAPLQATVKDANNNPLNGVTVTFTAPATGASAAFGGSATATAVTNSSGVATAPALTANSQAGAYAVIARVAGMGTAASFSLTNLSPGPSISATAGTPQSATVSTAFMTTLQATVKDAGNNPVTGVTVTFTAPATGASAAFGGSATATAVTNASGIATAPALTANSQAGGYTVTASAAGVGTAASFSLTNLAVSGGGSLSGADNTANLTLQGSADWVHWGDASLNRKAGVTPEISTYSIVGSGTVKAYTNDPRTLSWTDGTPTVAGSNEDGIYISSQKNGFSFTVPAGTTSQTLTVYVGGWDSGGTLTAHLSDASAADYVNTTTAVSGQYDGNYTLIFNAASAGQTLTITWVMTSGTGNVTLNGAALN